ncbi:hypothetical protein BaRGS_00009387, partial [Batillaria attramentaria]
QFFSVEGAFRLCQSVPSYQVFVMSFFVPHDSVSTDILVVYLELVFLGFSAAHRQCRCSVVSLSRPLFGAPFLQYIMCWATL